MANSFSASCLCPGSCQCRSQRVVDLRITWREALRRAQRSNGFLVFLDSNETKPPAQVGFGEIWIELAALGKSRDRLIPLLVPAWQVPPKCTRHPHCWGQSESHSGIPALHVPAHPDLHQAARAALCLAKSECPRAPGSVFMMPSYSSWAGSHFPCISKASAFSL